MELITGSGTCFYAFGPSICICMTSYLTHDELLKLAKLPTLKNRRLQDIAILMYKVKNELCPSYIKEIFQNNNINPYSFKNSDFVIQRFNTVS